MTDVMRHVLCGLVTHMFAGHLYIPGHSGSNTADSANTQFQWRCPKELLLSQGFDLMKLDLAGLDYAALNKLAGDLSQ